MPTSRMEKPKKIIQKKPIVIANWKASTLTYAEAEKKIKDTYANLSKDLSKIDLTIAPTISQTAMLSGYFSGKIAFVKKTSKAKGKKKTKEILPKVVFAAQDISVHEGGSKTGEVPVKAVKDTGVSKVIIGHSECRERGDTLEMVITKVKLALEAKLPVVLCIGEKQRDAGVAYLKVIDEQITSVFNAIDRAQHGQITLAYEPVWAINNKDNISLDAHGLHSMVVYIRKLLAERYGETIATDINILYGGSVTPTNAQDIYWNGEVQGLLIGRASFDAKTLTDVVRQILINPKKNILKAYGIHKKLHNLPTLNALRGKLRGKKVFLRADFNVPIQDGKITDTYRIDTTMDTFKFLKDEGAITIVVSHIETKDVVSPTLIPVFLYITKTYPQYTTCFCDNFLNLEEVATCLSSTKEGQFILFENIRRADKTGMSEKANDAALATYLKGYVEFYINDAFAVSHRKHTSVAALPELFDAEHKVAGSQLYKEVQSLIDAISPQKPLVTILSGAKFSTKLPLIEKYLVSADLLFVGGALYNNVLKSMGHEVGASLIDPEATYVDKLVQNQTFRDKVCIPELVVVQNKETKVVREANIKEVQKAESIMDIAPTSVKDFVRKIQDLDAKTIIWNGPIGNFEVAPFNLGTEKLAEGLLEYLQSSVLQDVSLIIGGGDTVSAIQHIDGIATNPNIFVSTGGGAMLEFLEKEGMIPGVMSLVS